MTADHTCAGCACQAEHDGDYGAPGHPGPCPPHTCPVTADHTPERQPTLPFTLRMPTNRVDNPDGGSLNTGTNYVDVQVILDPDMELRGECRSGYAGPVIALREWDEQVFLHELLHAAVAYAQPLVATTHPPHGHEVIVRVEVALWETGWRLAPAGRRPVTADHTPERLDQEEALARELYARGGGILWEGEESWQDHYLGVARDVLASDWFAALRAECDEWQRTAEEAMADASLHYTALTVLREQTARIEAGAVRGSDTSPAAVYVRALREMTDDPELLAAADAVLAALNPQDPDQERTSG